MDDDNRPRKMEIDFSSTVESLIPECRQKAKSGQLTEALESLAAMEKQTRLAADVFSTEKLLVCMCQLCYEAKDYDLLNENILTMTKKRSQLRQAVTKMVQECCKFVDEISDEPIKLKLIDTLRTVCEGKIYVENERARLTKILADIKEAASDIDAASKLMVDLQVETYNTMERREKVNFILEQMRLCLKNKDYIRAQIISKKVSTRYFEEEETHDLKLAFYQLMIDLDKHEGSFLDICKHYHAIYDTPRVKSNETDKCMALKCVVLYICLAGYSNEQSDFMNRISRDKELREDSLKSYHSLINLFLTAEIINWSQLVSEYSAEFRSDSAPDVFHKNEGGDSRWKSLRDRVVEHNIRIMTKYYTKVSLSRMSELLDLPMEEVEDCVSKLVFKKMIYARIDGLTNIVSFQEPKGAAKVLDDWSVNINSLMGLLSHTSHLIDKEIMVHKHASASKKTAAAAA